MIIKNVPKETPTAPAQIELSGVKDGDRFNFQSLQQALQQAANPPAGVSYENGITVAAVTPTVAAPNKTASA